MKTKITIEDLHKEFDFSLKSLKLKEAPFWMIYSQFLEQKLIGQSQEPKQMEVSEELQYQNLTCLVNGFELNTYQKGLAKQEYKKLLSMKEREQTEVSEDLINDIDKLILKWLNSQSENTTQLSFDIVTLFKSKTK